MLVQGAQYSNRSRVGAEPIAAPLTLTTGFACKSTASLDVKNVQNVTPAHKSTLGGTVSGVLGKSLVESYDKWLEMADAIACCELRLCFPCLCHVLE